MNVAQHALAADRKKLRPLKSAVEAVEKPATNFVRGQSEKRWPLTRPRIADLRFTKGKVTPESLHSGTINTFSTVSLYGHNPAFSPFPKSANQLSTTKEETNMSTRDHLNKFNHKEFFENIGEFRGYIAARKEIARLNPDKLVNLLYVYFRSVLLYPSPDMRKYYITGPNGELFQIEFPGHTKDGEKRSVSLGEMSSALLSDVCTDLLKGAHTGHFMSLVDLFTCAIATPSLEKHHKINILNAENTVLNEKFFDAIRELPEQKANDALDVREQLVLSELRSLEQAQKTDEDQKNILSLNNILVRYIRGRIEILIAQNKFLDIFQFLYQSLDKYHDTGGDQQVINTLLHSLVIYNNLFLVEPKENIRERVVECRGVIGEVKYIVLDEMLNFSPERIELKNFSIEPVELDKQNFRFGGVDYKEVRTVISFVIHYQPEESYRKFEYPEGYTIEFIRLRNLFDDPVFLFLNSLQQNISGMPTSIFSDAVGNIGNSTIVRITLNEFNHPDFELVDDRIRYIDFEEKEATIGRRYYPHKDRIIELLRKLHSDHADNLPIDIKREDININIVSNYLVNYQDQFGTSIFHKVHTITNLDSYLRVKERYLETIAHLNLSDEFPEIRKLMIETELVTAGTFRNFINQILNLTVKKQIELGGINRFLWKDFGFKEPRNETEIQPLIMSHLKPILGVKGIQISREIVAANGSLDFLCSYNYAGRPFKVGIELKKAHHEKLVNGLTQQLPQYLKYEETKHGIFVVLWFKNSNFVEPSKYVSIDNLITKLEKSIPKKHEINIMVIDCTKPIPPSKM
jgi:hypothetical protein